MTFGVGSLTGALQSHMKHIPTLNHALLMSITSTAALSLVAMHTAHGAIISAPLLVTEAVNSKIQYVDLATNSVKTLYQEDNVRFNAAAVDATTNNLYFFKIANSTVGETPKTYNELWRMDLSGSLAEDATAGAGNANSGKLQMLGQFDLGATGAAGETPILGATFSNGNLFLVGTNANQVWAIPTTTLDAAATTNRLVSAGTAFTSADWATTTLTLPGSGTSMQPGDILVANGSFWFTGTGSGGTLGGARSIEWAASGLNTTVGTPSATAAALTNTPHPGRPGATYDSITDTYYSYEQSTGSFFTVNPTDFSKGTTLVSNSDNFKVFGDLTTFTYLNVINYVPEPSSALLAVLGSVALLRRRRD